MPTRLAPLFLATLTASAVAQATPCFAANDQNSAVSSFIYSSGPNPGMRAWQISSPTPIVAQSLRIYTGNNYTSQIGEYMSLEIWDDNNGPGSRLAGGSWKTNATNAWQGANLDGVVVMTANTNYWVVFIEPGWSTPPWQPGGAAMPEMFMSGGTWANAGSTALKVRIFCALLEVQSGLPYGSPCVSSTGSIGTMFTNEAPLIGNGEFRLEGSGFAGNALTFLVFGVIPGYPTHPVAGTASCFQSTDAFSNIVGTTGVGDVRAATALGHVSFPMPLPNSASAIGIYFSAQLAAFDAGATVPLPFVTSNALRITVF